MATDKVAGVAFWQIVWLDRGSVVTTGSGRIVTEDELLVANPHPSPFMLTTT
jgi:hypothetical protein